MTDITDQDRRDARKWADEISGRPTLNTIARAAMRYILATVDAPTPTLSEEWRDILEKQDAGEAVSFSGLLARTDQMEHYFEEARAEAILWEGKYEDVRESEKSLHIDPADADTEVDHLKRDLTEAYKTRDARADEVDRLRAEVERLTAERDGAREEIAWLRNGPGHTEVATDLPDPADVKPGEAWLVEVGGERRTAVKDGKDFVPWHTINTGGRLSYVRNDDVILIARLVPAPRDITSPDELDKLAPTSIFRDVSGWPGGITGQGEIMRMNGILLD